MSYEPKTWQCGDTITAEDLNRMEQGIAQGGGGSALLEVGVEWILDEHNNSVGVLDKTWQEISDAFPNAYVINEGSKYIVGIVGIVYGQYGVQTALAQFATDDPNGYPRTTGMS